jgi:hypothetical protein
VEVGVAVRSSMAGSCSKAVENCNGAVQHLAGTVPTMWT